MKFDNVNNAHSELNEYGSTSGEPTSVSNQKSGSMAKTRKASSITKPAASPKTKSVSQSPTVGKGSQGTATDSSNMLQARVGELPVNTVVKDTGGREMGVVVSKVGNEQNPDTVVVKNRLGKFQTINPKDRVMVDTPKKESAFEKFVSLPLVEQLRYVENIDQKELEEAWSEVNTYPSDNWAKIGTFLGKHILRKNEYRSALSDLKALIDRKKKENPALRHDLTYYAGLITRTRTGLDTRTLADLYLSTVNEDSELDENLRKWFKDQWVRFGPDGKIRGDCARGDDSEGKPKCLPRSKAHRLGKKGRASAARRKRRLDPNAERRGAAKNVATKKESVVEYTNIPFNVCPGCGGSIVHISEAEGKKDACYHKVKSRYRVWPSAYASGALVQCRKVGAANWGNSKNESVQNNSTMHNEINRFLELIDSSTPFPVKNAPNMMFVTTTATPQQIFDVLTQRMGYKKSSGYDHNPKTWTTLYSADTMITKSDPVINVGKGMQVYYEAEHGTKIKVYFYQYKTVANESLDCAHGKYYCSTDKKWKCRKAPKKSRSVKEGAVPDTRKLTVLKQLLSTPLRGDDVKSQMLAFFAIPSPQMIKDFREAIAMTGGGVDLRSIVKQHAGSLHPSMRQQLNLQESNIVEYSSLDSAKKEIISAVNSIDPNPKDDKLAQQNAQLIDKLYNVLNKSNVLDRISAVLPDVIKGEYSAKDVSKIAQLLADAPLSFNDKNRFADNLKNNNVINAAIFITPGVYSVDQLTYNDPVNKKMLDYMKMYGVGQQMKGPLEHALAIFSKDISIAGKGDITVGGEPVELKAAIGAKANSGGGRFGETGKLPTREKMLSIIMSFKEIAPAVEEFLMKQKSMNIITFVQLVNQLDVSASVRSAIANKVFGEIFGAEAKPVIAEFSKPNADPEAVRKAYMISNFNWYKNSEMGGKWKYLAAVGLAANAVAVVASGADLLNVPSYSSNPAIITTDKPQEMLFQFNPRGMK